MSEPPPPPYHDAADQKPGPLLPVRDGRDGALMFVIAVLCALACLAVLAGSASDRAVRGWSSDLRASATIQVRPKPGETSAEAAARAAEAVSGVKGVSEARALEREAAVKLLEPWLGKGGVPDDMPIPELVTVDLDPAHPADAAALTAALVAAKVDGSVDDHGRWLKDVERAAFAVRLEAIGAALALAAAAAAAASPPGRACRRGARWWRCCTCPGPRTVSSPPCSRIRFARLSALAGVQGMAVAAVIWVVLRVLTPADGFSPLLPQSWTDFWLILPCPILAGVIGASSARRSAMHILRTGYGHGRGG